jgi:hypothetical protein
MAGYTTTNANPITDPNALTTAILSAYVSGGTTIWYQPVANGDIYPDSKTRHYLVQSTNSVDTYLSTDPTQVYRILFVMTYDIDRSSPASKVTSMTMYVGNDEQLKINALGTAVTIQAGTIGWTVFGGAIVPSAISEFNYRITFTSRGSAMAIWRANTANRVENNFVCVIQRPVNPTSGLVKVEGTAPIFAMWHASSSTANYFNWGVVRELDKPASIPLGSTNAITRYNMYRITMEWSHPNLFDNNSHVVKFPYGFATSRHLYLDELDMVCLVNATAFASQQDAQITMYGEQTQRKYRTVWGEVLYGNVLNVLIPQPKVVSGARLGILSEGGGVDAPTP